MCEPSSVSSRHTYRYGSSTSTYTRVPGNEIQMPWGLWGARGDISYSRSYLASASSQDFIYTARWRRRRAARRGGSAETSQLSSRVEEDPLGDSLWPKVKTFERQIFQATAASRWFCHEISGAGGLSQFFLEYVGVRVICMSDFPICARQKLGKSVILIWNFSRRVNNLLSVLRAIVLMLTSHQKFFVAQSQNFF